MCILLFFMVHLEQPLCLYVCYSERGRMVAIYIGLRSSLRSPIYIASLRTSYHRLSLPQNFAYVQALNEVYSLFLHCISLVFLKSSFSLISIDFN